MSAVAGRRLGQTMRHTLNVHCLFRFWHRVQAPGSSSRVPWLRASQPTRERRHSSPLENCVRRRATPTSRDDPRAGMLTVLAPRRRATRRLGDGQRPHAGRKTRGYLARRSAAQGKQREWVVKGPQGSRRCSDGRPRAEFSCATGATRSSRLQAGLLPGELGASTTWTHRGQ